jgi:hypothetical protein
MLARTRAPLLATAPTWRICCVMRAMPPGVADIAFSAPFKRLLLRAIAIWRRRDRLMDGTLLNTLPIWITGSIASWLPAVLFCRSAARAKTTGASTLVGLAPETVTITVPVAALNPNACDGWLRLMTSYDK